MKRIGNINLGIRVFSNTWGACMKNKEYRNEYDEECIILNFQSVFWGLCPKIKITIVQVSMLVIS